MNINGYETITNMYNDLTSVEQNGAFAVNNAIKDFFNQWKNNYRYLTELAIILDYKIREHKDDNNELAQVYGNVYLEVENYATTNLKGAQQNYYLHATDGDIKWANYYLRICEGMEV